MKLAIRSLELNRLPFGISIRIQKNSPKMFSPLNEHCKKLEVFLCPSVCVRVCWVKGVNVCARVHGLALAMNGRLNCGSRRAGNTMRAREKVVLVA